MFIERLDLINMQGLKKQTLVSCPADNSVLCKVTNIHVTVQFTPQSAFKSFLRDVHFHLLTRRALQDKIPLNNIC